MKEKLKVLDLFSGIGGFSLGLERTGYFETLAFCEIDQNCQKVLRKHWPLTKIYSDIQDLNGYRFSGIDVVCGGFPCQDISIAGKKKGMKDEHGKRTRSGLWEEMLRIIEESEPRYAIIENVSNLLNKGLARVLKDLHSIGYDAEWHIISAESIGAFHKRERIWIIAYPNSNGSSSRTIKDRQVQANQKRKTQEIYNEREKCLTEPIENCAILSRGAIDHAKNTQAETFALVSSVRRIVNGIPKWLHEYKRRERIKQLGNSVVPQIPELIGRAIYEREKEIYASR